MYEDSGPGGLAYDGFWIVGRFQALLPIRYGPLHPTKAGQDVPGMRRIVVSVGGDEWSDERVEATFFLDQRGEPTRMAQDVEDLDLTTGDRIAVFAQMRQREGSTRVNWDARRVLVLERHDRPASPVTVNGDHAGVAK